MWEVVARHPVSGDERKKVVASWDRVRQLKDRAISMGWRVMVQRCWCDVLVADSQTGCFIRSATRVTPQWAAKYSIHWRKVDGQSGLIVWPHGIPIPESWEIVD